MSISFQIAQAVSRRPVTQNGGADSVPGQAILRFMLEKVAMEQGFLKVLLVFYCRIIPSMFHIHLRPSTTCEPSNKEVLFPIPGKALETEALSH